MNRYMNERDYLDFAQLFAKKNSGCRKVAVGSVIVKDGQMIGFGANRAIPDLCATPRGCLRIEKYGEDSKSHRNPEDCRAIHSEIDALSQLRESAEGASIYITRYPCEGCAKALIAARINEVYYGGTAKISPQTKDMFDYYGIAVYPVEGWSEDNTDR